MVLFLLCIKIQKRVNHFQLFLATTSDGPATTDAALAALAAEAGLIDPVQEPSGGISFMVATEDPAGRDEKAEDGINGNEGVAAALVSQQGAGEPMQVDGEDNFVIPQVDGPADLFLSEDENKAADSEGESMAEHAEDPPAEEESPDMDQEAGPASIDETSQADESSTKETETSLSESATVNVDLDTNTPADVNVEPENAAQQEANSSEAAAEGTSEPEPPSESDMQVDTDPLTSEDAAKSEGSIAPESESIPDISEASSLKEDEIKEEFKDESKDDSKEDDKDDQMDDDDLELKLPKDDSELEDEVPVAEKEDDNVPHEDNEPKKEVEKPIEKPGESLADAEQNEALKTEKQQDVSEPMVTDSPAPTPGAADKLNKEPSQKKPQEERKEVVSQAKELATPLLTIQKKKIEPEAPPMKLETAIKVEPKEVVHIKKEPLKENRTEESSSDYESSDNDSAALTALATAAEQVRFYKNYIM